MIASPILMAAWAFLLLLIILWFISILSDDENDTPKE